MIRTLSFAGRGLAGPPLLLVHGFPLDRTLWRHQVDGLADVARVVTPDLPGFGETPAATDGRSATTMGAYGDHVLALADALGFERFVLAGLSMGGYVALDLARRKPDRLAGLILCDTRAEPDSEQGRQDRLRQADATLADGTDALARTFPERVLAAATLAHEPEVRAWLERTIRATPRQGIAAALRGMAERPDSRPGLGRIAAPTLVVVGEDDPITPPDAARALAAAIPAAELVVIPRAGHLSPIEQPDAVTDALRQYLARLPA